MQDIAARYLGLIEFNHALREQERIARGLAQGTGDALILGFESEPVVTLGLRATAADAIAARWPRVRVDRGGQATLHNPGQLVIFPVCDVRALGSKAWVERLIDVTRRLGLQYGHALAWRGDSPGLYDDRGKVASIGLRVRRGVSTHGVSINIRNSLDDFAQIRTCGRSGAAMSHLRTNACLGTVFTDWMTHFRALANVT